MNSFLLLIPIIFKQFAAFEKSKAVPIVKTMLTYENTRANWGLTEDKIDSWIEISWQMVYGEELSLVNHLPGMTDGATSTPKHLSAPKKKK